jgi:hypothetical protein
MDFDIGMRRVAVQHLRTRRLGAGVEVIDDSAGDQGEGVLVRHRIGLPPPRDGSEERLALRVDALIVRPGVGSAAQEVGTVGLAIVGSLID